MQRPLPDNTQHSQETDIHAPGGIRTRNPSQRAAADLRLRPSGHWDRQTNYTPVLIQALLNETRLAESWRHTFLVSRTGWGRFISITPPIAMLAGKISLELNGGAARMDWTVRVANPVGVRLCSPDWPSGLPSLLCNS
jgi:hypothetical protein